MSSDPVFDFVARSFRAELEAQYEKGLAAIKNDLATFRRLGIRDDVIMKAWRRGQRAPMAHTQH